MKKRPVDNKIAALQKQYKTIIWEIAELWAQHKALSQQLIGKSANRDSIIQSIEYVEERIAALQQAAEKLHKQIFAGIGAR